ncbi:MAG: hypothetical protein EAZ91_16195 [Cytophagales bacterium]|nr:MAG: hypothetical protein EAZ91_16195 [Cytophagales bacterium]
MLALYNHITSKFHKRERLFFYAAISSVTSKLVNIIVAVASLPLIYNCIGKERYGMMLTITSISTLITFADLGLGFGLQSKIPLLIGDERALHKVISSAFFFLTTTAILILSVFLVAFLYIDWVHALHLSSPAAKAEVNLSVILFAICILIVIPFSIVQKIQIGAQKGYITNFWITGGNLLGIILLYIAYTQNASTPVVILCIYGSNSLFLLFNFIHHFIKKENWLFPRFNLIDFQVIRGILKESSFFFLVQLLSLLLFVSNNLVLVHYYGPDKVTEFNIVYKLVVLFLLPLEASAPFITPAINEAMVNNDRAWVKSSINKLLTIALGLAILTALFTYLFGNNLITVWLGNDVFISSDVILSVAIFMLLYANIGCALSYIMLSSSLIKTKTILYVIAVVVALLSKLWVTKVFGVSGVFWSTTLPMFVLYIIPCLFVLRSKKLI